MIKEKLRNAIFEIYEDAIVFDNPNFDDSIIGVSNDGRIIYSLNKMIDELSKEDEIDTLEAEEFINYNTIRSL